MMLNQLKRQKVERRKMHKIEKEYVKMYFI